jgi:phospholipid/cholesterol/gamma-HCH transport system substrate-binding protein
MLTRFVRTQLIAFAIASVIGMAVMAFTYMQVPTLLGLGKTTVKLDLPEAGGLYRFSNVTYNGVQVGKVTGVELTDTGARATLSLDRSPKIPADLQANVLSVSAVGEQYVDLRPRTESGPYLENGSVIASDNVTVPQQVGPMLDNLSGLVNSLPKEKISKMLDETYLAFNGAGYDFQSLIDSAAKISADGSGVADQMRTLVQDGEPLLDSQVQSTEAIRTWANSLAGVTGQLNANDAQIRTLLERGPGFADEVSGLLTDLKPTLPVLLGNLSTVGQILMTYNPAIEQILVLVPNYIAWQQSFGLSSKNAAGLGGGDFTLTIGDPNPCTVGFLPPTQWRSPSDTSFMETPDGLYCKLPQDSPVSVRGARNYPCIEHPGKRAPTVELCDDPRGFQPLAMRPHITGPMPFDPNLVAQGLPLDTPATGNEHIFAPMQGTPLPPGQVPAGAPPGSPPEVPVIPFPNTPPPPPPAAPPTLPPPGNSLNGVPIPPVTPPAPGAAPAGYARDGDGPSIAVVPYDPRTGKYTTPDGKLEQRPALVENPPDKWTDLLPT